MCFEMTSLSSSLKRGRFTACLFTYKRGCYSATQSVLSSKR